jgi:uncharacterized protein YcbK (DUF882 family)
LKSSTVPRSIGLGAWLAVGLFAASVLTVAAGPAQSRESDRTLKLYHLHTGEKGEFTFKRNGQYDRAELVRLNRFLRDWRKEQPITMDPHLFDLIWSIYRESGSNGYIDVVCGYRTVGTNDMLRSRGRGVASHSQHSLGKAMDFFIPGVPLAKLRTIAMRFQGGGVGYYPTSGSPFVHVDTGHVRMWPRMTRQQLLAVFPRGDTLYLPADGKPLPGYQVALARLGSSRGGGTALAYLDSNADEGDSSADNGGGWLKRVFGGGGKQDKTSAPIAVASAAAPISRPAAKSVPEPVVAAPQAEPIEVAAADTPVVDPRLPKARPEAAVMAATEPTAPEAAAAQPPLVETVASLAFAPLPRTRPDPTLLVDTLRMAASAPAALAVRPEDAIAALAARSAEGAASPHQDMRPIQVAYAGPESEPDPVVAPASPEVSMPVVAEAVPLPRPRPHAMASAEADLPASLQAHALLRAHQIAEAAASGSPATSARELAAVSTRKAALAAQDAGFRALPPNLSLAREQDEAFSGFAMPQPAGVTSLFRVPGTAADVATRSSARPDLPTGRFALGEAQAGIGEPSFFTRLFASLTE